MSDSDLIRVRYDPRPIIHDRRALVPYCEVPDDSTLAIRDRLTREIAMRLGIPKSLLNGGDSNYSSARMECGRGMTHQAVQQFADMARRRLLMDIKRMALLRYQIDLYLLHHRRLPGSTRTARLRKKRITVVQAWCNRYYKRLISQTPNGKPFYHDLDARRR